MGRSRSKRPARTPWGLQVHRRVRKPVTCPEFGQHQCSPRFPQRAWTRSWRWRGACTGCSAADSSVSGWGCFPRRPASFRFQTWPREGRTKRDVSSGGIGEKIRSPELLAEIQRPMRLAGTSWVARFDWTCACLVWALTRTTLARWAAGVRRRTWMKEAPPQGGARPENKWAARRVYPFASHGKQKENNDETVKRRQRRSTRRVRSF